jgi:DNA-binding transcriptional MocR family regulator
MTQALTIAGARLVGVESGREGPDLDHLVRIVAEHRPVLLYLSPTFQNPTGYTIPAGARAALVEMARRHGFRIVEDDPYRELRYEAEPVPSIASFDDAEPHQRVVVGTGSLSKVLAPGLRVGWLRPPADIRPAVNLAKQAFDLHSATLTQQIVVRYLLGGRFEGSLERTRALYRERRDAMIEALPAALPEGSEWSCPTGGMFVWVRLPEGFDSLRLLEAATAEGVVFSPGVPFYTDAPDPRRIRLSYTTYDPERIREGLRRVAKAVGAVAG